ncbi:spermidine/putrescine ABC transporter substrate-binding protein [Streptomyces sp. NBC_01794]|uniref:polyamine ABC transporter substrate-binding protein n=1 Tax=Streptomyces sp. NBC_01794 TaxID=2975942 RepID=UPI00308E53A7|nr:spermidine/putrescine ABC transporter substrate-binding protein [Streptomyces sp. NBC_01794]WSB05167.1 spermidine/putrescine ABC transporter substrate-binding protein [Streptomyces sp. NBC_01794]
MTFHPRERTADTGRRALLRGVGLLALGALGVPACSGSGKNSRASTVALARPDHPVTLPTFSSLQPVENGLSPEVGTLKVLNYADYVSPEIVRRFGKEYGVTVEITTFSTMTEALSKLRSGSADYDVVFPTPDIISRAVAGRLVQPLNHSYLGNLKNVLPALQDPFYDKGSRYTVPYNVYSTGIGYRTDRIPELPDNPYDLFWDSSYRGKVYVIDDYREALGMVMLRSGPADVNTDDAATIQAAADSLSAMLRAVRVKVGNQAPQFISDGSATVHQAWNGDMIASPSYLPKGVSPDVIGYWYPGGNQGVVGSDMMAIPAAARHPVLAHHFLNYLLDTKMALLNMKWIGYQPAQKTFTPQRMVTEGLVPAHLRSAIITAEDFEKGQQLLVLSPGGESRWQDAWASFKAGT